MNSLRLMLLLSFAASNALRSFTRARVNIGGALCSTATSYSTTRSNMCSVTASDEPTKDISEQHHDNDPLSIEVTLKVDSSSTGGSGGNKKNKRKFKFDIFPRADLIECVRTRDYDLALRIFAQVKEQNRLSATFLYSLLSVCYKAEHLESAQLFFNEILNQGQSPTEQAYLALIRCYSDANRFEESLSLVKSMQELNIEVRHRTFQPILDAFLRNNDLENILNIMFKMIFLGIHPRSEQVTALLKCCALVDASPFQDAVNAIMMESSKDLIGLDYQNILELKLAFEDISNQTLEVEGILVDSIESIPGSVLEKTESYVIAQNNTFNISASLESFEDARVSLKTVSDIEANLDTYDIIDTSSSRVSNEVVSDFTSSFFKADMPTFVEDRYTVRSTNFTSRRANIVDISSSSCMCPNCGARIQTIKLSEDTKEAARVALMRVASAASISHCKNLQNFSIWLEERQEYKYIIDGANVAYNRQNFGQGRFSYRQIEFLVDTLRKQTDERILVLIPQTYVNKVVPNSAKNRGGQKFSQITADDQRILDRLKAEDMLYAVPIGANDDWYWLYATVAAGRESYAVTNDLTRDHRLAFLESRMYMRWRSNHIMHFDTDKAIENITDTAVLKLTYPELFTREVQYENNRWHLPATDRHAWLCVNIGQNTNVTTTGDIDVFI